MRALLGQKTILGLALLLLLIFCLYPFLLLIFKISFPQGQFNLSYFTEAAYTPATAKALQNTIVVSILVSMVSVLMAIPLAWLFTRTDLPRARQLRSWFCLPYAIPPYIGAIAWIYLANPTTGQLNLLLGGTYFNIYSFSGLVWVMASFFYTLILLGLLSALERTDSSLEEAARISGASPLQTFIHITLPLLRPAIFSGALLVALAAAASFGVPALVGTPAKIYLMTTQIYTYQKMGSMGGLYKAGALSIVLLVLALVFLLINSFLQGSKGYQTVAGKSSRPSLVELGRWQWPVIIFLYALLFVVFALPVIGIGITALSKVQGQFGVDNFGMQNFYRILFETDETGRAIFNSFYLASMAASLATALGLLLAYVQWKTRLPGRHLLDVIASFPYSTPGTVVALALILAFSNGILGVGPSLYNTLALLWIAYIVKYLSFSVKTLGNGFLQIDDVLAEAARVAGASWFETLKSIWMPLLKPAIIAAWFLIFMPTFSELTMTIMLTGPGIETVGTLLFQLQEYADTGGGGAAVLSLMVIGLVLGINMLVKKLSKGQFGL